MFSYFARGRPKPNALHYHPLRYLDSNTFSMSRPNTIATVRALPETQCQCVKQASKYRCGSDINSNAKAKAKADDITPHDTPQQALQYQQAHPSTKIVHFSQMHTLAFTPSRPPSPLLAGTQSFVGYLEHAHQLANERSKVREGVGRG